MTSTVFERVLIVDDNPTARRAYAFTVEDADLDPVTVEGPLDSLDAFIADTPMTQSGALCDFELSVRNFASFTGAELAAAWYRSGIPAVLCTRYEKAQLDRIRPFRAWIPTLITPSQLTPEALVDALSVTLREIQGSFLQSRMPHRTLVRVLERDPDDERYFLFEMPAWSSDTMLRYRISDLPIDVQPRIAAGFRTHVAANLGAESFEELYFTRWEQQ